MATGGLFLSFNSSLWKIVFYRIYTVYSHTQGGYKSWHLATSALTVSRLIYSCSTPASCLGVPKLTTKPRNKGLAIFGKLDQGPLGNRRSVKPSETALFLRRKQSGYPRRGMFLNEIFALWWFYVDTFTVSFFCLLNFSAFLGKKNRSTAYTQSTVPLCCFSS